VTTQTPPAWLAPPAANHIPNIGKNPPATELLHTRYRIIFESVMERMYSGATLSAVLADDFRDVNVGAYIRWIRKDKELNRRYEEAKEIRAETWSGKIIEEAEGINHPNDTARSKLIIDTYKWLMGIDNKQYRPSQQVEINSQISITAAIEQGMSRALNRPVIEGDWDEEA